MSNENYRGFEQNVTEWYRNYLGREPDQTGWDGYMGQLIAGRNPYEVAHEIRYSDEGRAYQQKLNDAQQAKLDLAYDQANRNQTKYDQAAAQARDFQTKYNQAVGERDQLKGRIGGFEERIRGFERDIDDYRFKQEQLQGQYDTALGQVQNWTTKANEFQKRATDFENQFNKRTEEYEAARSEAEMYRNQAVGAQLRALRSGATSGGGNQTGRGGGNLASGRPQYQNLDDKAVEVEKNIQAESGALSNKGPVVERINRRPSGGSSTQGQRSPLAQGAGSGSYYASRFS